MKRGIPVLAAALVVGSALAGAPALAKGKDPVVYQTVSASQTNTFFDIDYLYHAQVGQSLTVERPMTWKSLEMGTYQVKLVKDPKVYALLVDGKYDENWFVSHMSNYRVKAQVTVEVWRYTGEGPIPETLDLQDSFEKVHGSTVKSTMNVGKRVTFPLKGGVSVEPGKYFVVIGIRFDDPRVFNLRFTGQENGTNTKGGYDHDHPVRPECARYKMTKDTHPGGQAYRVMANHRPEPPNWMAPFATTFEVAETKVAMPCNMDGIYDPNEQIWNPGDLSMAFRGS